MSNLKLTMNIDLNAQLDEILDDILNEIGVFTYAARNQCRKQARLDVPVDVHELLAKQQCIALIWSVEDVLAIRPDLNREHAWEVLKFAHQVYEPYSGLTTRDLNGLALHLFGPRPQITARIKESLRCVTFGPQVFPYQCFLHDGRCVLIRRDLSEHSVIQSRFSAEDDTPHILPLDRVPGAVFAILEQVLAIPPGE